VTAGLAGSSFFFATSAYAGLWLTLRLPCSSDLGRNLNRNLMRQKPVVFDETCDARVIAST
jgi:hypothetical protein